MPEHERLLLQVLLLVVKPILAPSETDEDFAGLLSEKFGLETSELLNIPAELEPYLQQIQSLSHGDTSTLPDWQGPADGGLVPIFENVSLPKTANQVGSTQELTAKNRYRPRVLDISPDTSPEELEDLLFPSHQTDASPLGKNALWRQFLSEAEKLPSTDFQSTFDCLYFLLQKYTSFIPTETFPDIPLFDHLRTTMAIAVCLLGTSQIEPTEIPQQGSREILGDGENQSQPFLFVRGDLSGIQHFIYSVASPPGADAHASVHLRGRSFYVGLFVETVAQYLLKKLGLYQPHLLWCDGGNFLLLVPNSLESHRAVDETATIANQFLLQQSGGKLYLNLVDHSVNLTQLNNLSDPFNELSYLTAHSKSQKHKTLLSGGEVDFALGAGVCAICERDVQQDERGDEENCICDECVKQRRIGINLVQLKSLIRIDGDIEPGHPSGPHAEGEADEVLIQFAPEFGISWCFNQIGTLVDGVINRLTIYTINATREFLNTDREGITQNRQAPISYGYRFLANRVKTTDEAIKGDSDENSPSKISKSPRLMTFGELAKSSFGRKEISRLGVLRMDVDNLEAIFSFGLLPFNLLSRVTALSHSIHLFFSVYLDALCRYSLTLSMLGEMTSLSPVRGTR